MRIAHQSSCCSITRSDHRVVRGRARTGGSQTMRNGVSRLSIAALVAAMAACGGSRYPADTPGGAPAPSRAERQANVITSEEMQDPAIYSRDAYTAIRHLR